MTDGTDLKTLKAAAEAADAEFRAAEAAQIMAALSATRYDPAHTLINLDAAPALPEPVAVSGVLAVAVQHLGARPLAHVAGALGIIATATGMTEATVTERLREVNTDPRTKGILRRGTLYGDHETALAIAGILLGRMK